MIRKFLFLFAFICIISSVYSVTTIGVLPYNITTPGEYNISGNLSSTGHGIIISTQNVSLNCEGYTMRGDSGASDYGIYISAEAYDYNNISNCNLINFGAGIYDNAGDNNSFQNITITNISGSWNVYLNTNSFYNTFNNITINTSSIRYSVYSLYSEYNTINNSKLGDGYAVFAASDNSKMENSYFTHSNSYVSISRNSDANDCLVDLINVTKPDGKYIYNIHSTVNIDGWTNISQLILCNADNSTIQNLNLVGNRQYPGITIIETSNSTFSNLNISNYTSGISVAYSLNDVFNNLNLYSNSQDGIDLATGSNNHIFNYINSYNNSIRGIYLAGSSNNNNFTNINSSFNTQYGIDSSASSNNIFSNSTIYDSGYIDIYIYGTTDAHCNNIISNITDNYGNYHYYFNQSINIDGWTNISSLSLCNADNSIVKNLNYDGLNDKGTLLYTTRTEYSNFSNLNISNYYYGIILNTNSNYNNLNNFTTSFSTYGVSVGSSSNNTISNFNSYNNSARGFYIAFGGNNNISNFTTYNSLIGVGLGSSTYNNLTNFSTYKNTQFGIDNQANDNYFENFNSYNNSLHGFSTSGQRNRFNNFSTYYNTQSGVYLTNALNTNLSNFSSYSNSQYGVYLENAYYNKINNGIIYKNTQAGFRIFSAQYNLVNNVTNYNNTLEGFSIQTASDNNFTNINSYYNTKGVYFFGDADYHLILNSSILNNTYDLYFLASGVGGIYKPENNTFYNNYLGNISKIYSNNWTNINYFNSSLSGYNIGNYWNDLGVCSSYQTIGIYKVCLNPANYTINSTNNIYDFAPLIVAPEYISPTPRNNTNLGGTSFTIRVEDTQGVSTWFNATINGVNYPLTNISSTEWEYSLTTEDFVGVTNITFNVSYAGNGIMETRIFTFYPNHASEAFPVHTLLSGLITIMLILIGGFYLNKK